MTGLGMQSEVGAAVVRQSGQTEHVPPELMSRFAPKGWFKIEQYRGDEKIAEWDVPNGVTDEGINTALDILFHESQSKIQDWYIGLVDASGFTSFASGDTMSSHGGWSEFTSYDETVRQNWEPDVASGKSISNSTAVQFSINASGDLKGIFVVSDNTKSGSSGKLWATAQFSSNISVVSGDTLKITYTVSAS